MLGMTTYPPAYIDACRARVQAHLAAYRQQAGPAPSKDFKHRYFADQVLLLDHLFVHRLATVEGQDGNPLNEVRGVVQLAPVHRRPIPAPKTPRLAEFGRRVVQIRARRVRTPWRARRRASMDVSQVHRTQRGQSGLITSRQTGRRRRATWHECQLCAPCQTLDRVFHAPLLHATSAGVCSRIAASAPATTRKGLPCLPGS